VDGTQIDTALGVVQVLMAECSPWGTMVVGPEGGVENKGCACGRSEENALRCVSGLIPAASSSKLESGQSS
jgi:hypothetical protein